MAKRRARAPVALTPAQAIEALRAALLAGLAWETRHCRERMAERMFDMNDVLVLSKGGAVKRAPEFDIKQGNFTYVAEGNDADGKALEIVFAVDAHGNVALATGRRP